MNVRALPVFDAWTFPHFGIGVAYAMVGIPLVPTLVGLVGWELIETPMANRMPKLFASGPERPMNAVIDIVVALAGWYFVRAIRG